MGTSNIKILTRKRKMQNQEKIDIVLNICSEAEADGTKYCFLSYEEGVKAGIEWVMAKNDEGYAHPFDL